MKFRKLTAGIMAQVMADETREEMVCVAVFFPGDILPIEGRENALEALTTIRDVDVEAELSEALYVQLKRTQQLSLIRSARSADGIDRFMRLLRACTEGEQIPLTHYDIGFIVGCTRENVSNHMRKIRKELGFKQDHGSMSHKESKLAPRGRA